MQAWSLDGKIEPGARRIVRGRRSKLGGRVSPRYGIRTLLRNVLGFRDLPLRLGRQRRFNVVLCGGGFARVTGALGFFAARAVFGEARAEFGAQIFYCGNDLAGGMKAAAERHESRSGLRCRAFTEARFGQWRRFGIVCAA